MNKYSDSDYANLVLHLHNAELQMRHVIDAFWPDLREHQFNAAMRHIDRINEIIKSKTNGLPQSGETKEDNNGTQNHRPDNPDSGKPHHLDGSETKPVI